MLFILFSFSYESDEWLVRFTLSVISHLSYKCEMCVIAQRYGCVWSNDGFCVIHLFLCHSKAIFFLCLCDCSEVVLCRWWCGKWWCWCSVMWWCRMCTWDDDVGAVRSFYIFHICLINVRCVWLHRDMGVFGQMMAFVSFIYFSATQQ